MSHVLRASLTAVLLAAGAGSVVAQTTSPSNPPPSTTTVPGSTMGTPPVTAPRMATPAPYTAAPATTTPGTNAAPAAVNTTDNPSRTTAAPVPGANSFTEGEARRRIEDKGFGQVTGLKKDDQGIWRGMSMKDGKSVNVALDYQGNVVSQ